MQYLQGQFPAFSHQFDSTTSQPVNFFDSPSGGSGWTPGGQIILPIPAQPTIVKPWTIYGFSIQGQGFLWQLPPKGVYGLVGKILGAILIGGSFAPQNNTPFTAPPQSAQPNLITAYDGSQDPVFPTFAAAAAPFPAGGYFGASQQLPLPQALKAGDQLGIGVWLTPSIVNSLGVGVHGLQYTVSYGYGT